MLNVARRFLKTICGTATCDACGRKFYAGFYCDDNCFDAERVRGPKGQRYCPECLIRRKPLVIYSRWLTILPFGIYNRLAKCLSRLFHTKLAKPHRWSGCKECLRMYGERHEEMYQ